MTSEKSLSEAASQEHIEKKENLVNEHHSERKLSYANFLHKICRRLLIHASAQRFRIKRPGSKRSPSAIITIDTLAELKYLEAKLSNSTSINQQLIDQAVELIKKISRNERFYERRKKPLFEMPTLSSSGLLQNCQCSKKVELFKKLGSLLSSVMNEKFQKEFEQGQPNGENISRYKRLFYILKKLSPYLHADALNKIMPFASTSHQILNSAISGTLT